jgi:hypothetical protein
MSEQPIDPGDVERTRRYIRQLVQEINHLSGADIPPQQFFGEFLQRVVSAVAAVGGAVWSREGQQPPRLQHQVNFGMSGLLDEAAGGSGHVPLLMGAFNNGSAKLIPPHSGAGAGAEREAGSNESDWSLLISPMQVDKQTIGVVELLLDPGRRPTALENAVRFVQELCDIGAGYLKNRQLKQMLNQQHLWSQLETFVREIHSSLTPKEVAYIVANEGKRMVGCDRLSVALLYGRKTVIEGVSGQEVIERKSTLVQLLNHLCRTVLQSGENLLYTGEQREDLPPAVRDALDDYVAESGSKILGITLLRTVDKEGAQGKPFGCLAGEQLEDASQPGTLIPRMEVVGQHGAIALANALSHHRVFMLPVWRTVGNATEWMRGNRLAKLSVAVAGAVAIALAMWLVPVELRMHGKGNFVPEHQRPVYAEEDGVVNRVDVESSQIVRPGDALLHIRNDQLELELNNRFQDWLKAREQLNAAQSELGAPGGGAGASSTAGLTAIVAEHDLQIHQQAIELLQKRKATTEVKSPIEGLIATFELKRKLFGRPVKRGEELLVVSQVEGKDEGGNDVRWVLKIRMPERNMGHILEAESRRRANNDTEPLKASFILSSYPQKTFYAHVEHINTTAEFDQDLKEHVVMIRIVPDNVVRFFVELAPAEGNPNIQRVANVQMEMKDGQTLKLSPEAEVKAKVNCGKCSLAYWTLGELVEWFYEVVWF